MKFREPASLISAGENNFGYSNYEILIYGKKPLIKCPMMNRTKAQCILEQIASSVTSRYNVCGLHCTGIADSVSPSAHAAAMIVGFKNIQTEANIARESPGFPLTTNR